MNKTINLPDPKALFFAERLRQSIASQIKEIILFGSRARGDASEGSDYDFAVILNKKDASSVDKVRRTEVEFLNRFDVLSSALIYDDNDWIRRKNMPIGINIRREGINL